ncbi:MAG TPA: VOC family protein [Vicinamibacterales bacterium]|jgi:predicted enzyme related to lactoylglutathione lyase
MRRVVGLGGVFFKAKDPAKLYAWYEAHLGLAKDAMSGAVTFENGGEVPGTTVWAIFKEDTKYFGPGGGSLMLNFRVDDLDALLAALAPEGVEIDPKREQHEYGKFAWIVDPEGNRIELWEPTKT